MKSKNNIKVSKLNQAWNSLVQDFDILNQTNKNGFFEINSFDIKKY
jgi:hypothetical protein